MITEGFCAPHLSVAASVFVLAAHMELREGGLAGLRVETGGKVHKGFQQ